MTKKRFDRRTIQKYLGTHTYNNVLKLIHGVHEITGLSQFTLNIGEFAIHIVMESEGVFYMFDDEALYMSEEVFWEEFPGYNEINFINGFPHDIYNSVEFIVETDRGNVVASVAFNIEMQPECCGVYVACAFQDMNAKSAQLFNLIMSIYAQNPIQKKGEYVLQFTNTTDTHMYEYIKKNPNVEIVREFKNLNTGNEVFIALTTPWKGKGKKEISVK